MYLTYKNPGLQYMIDNIMMFQNDEDSEFWREPLFAVYPQIDKNHFNALAADKRCEYIYAVMQDIYKDEESNISRKLVRYNQHWAENKLQVEDAFSTAFGVDCHTKFNSMVGYITLNPIEPRWLADTIFDVFYQNSERGALGTALHEIIHFVWFDVWQRHFNDDVREYEHPHLKWVFSEMVVDPIMRNDARLRDINPYFDDGCAYQYFYEMVIDGRPILETLNDMYKCMSILDFMEQGFEYCVKYEAEIREQMS